MLLALCQVSLPLLAQLLLLLLGWAAWLPCDGCCSLPLCTMTLLLLLLLPLL
jgi:hypothetical protein